MAEEELMADRLDTYLKNCLEKRQRAAKSSKSAGAAAPAPTTTAAACATTTRAATRAAALNAAAAPCNGKHQRILGGAAAAPGVPPGQGMQDGGQGQHAFGDDGAADASQKQQSTRAARRGGRNRDDSEWEQHEEDDSSEYEQQDEEEDAEEEDDEEQVSGRKPAKRQRINSWTSNKGGARRSAGGCKAHITADRRERNRLAARKSRSKRQQKQVQVLQRLEEVTAHLDSTTRELAGAREAHRREVACRTRLAQAVATWLQDSDSAAAATAAAAAGSAAAQELLQAAAAAGSSGSHSKGRAVPPLASLAARLPAPSAVSPFAAVAAAAPTSSPPHSLAPVPALVPGNCGGAAAQLLAPATPRARMRRAKVSTSPAAAANIKPDPDGPPPSTTAASAPAEVTAVSGAPSRSQDKPLMMPPHQLAVQQAESRKVSADLLDAGDLLRTTAALLTSDPLAAACQPGGGSALITTGVPRFLQPCAHSLGLGDKASALIATAESLLQGQKGQQQREQQAVAAISSAVAVTSPNASQVPANPPSDAPAAVVNPPTAASVAGRPVKCTAATRTATTAAEGAWLPPAGAPAPSYRFIAPGPAASHLLLSTCSNYGCQLAAPFMLPPLLAYPLRFTPLTAPPAVGSSVAPILSPPTIPPAGPSLRLDSSMLRLDSSLLLRLPSELMQVNAEHSIASAEAVGVQLPAEEDGVSLLPESTGLPSVPTLGPPLQLALPAGFNGVPPQAGGGMMASPGVTAGGLKPGAMGFAQEWMGGRTWGGAGSRATAFGGRGAVHLVDAFNAAAVEPPICPAADLDV